MQGWFVMLGLMFVGCSVGMAASEIKDGYQAQAAATRDVAAAIAKCQEKRP